MDQDEKSKLILEQIVLVHYKINIMLTKQGHDVDRIDEIAEELLSKVRYCND